ncbi:MAG: hypothetical protein L0191_07920 [Acidobacteria bacterium]|nr:hypothetical protein [Acidobacteriota bacterium]
MALDFSALFGKLPGLYASGLRGKRLGEDRRREIEREDAERQREIERDALQRMLLQEQIATGPTRRKLLEAQTADAAAQAAGTGRYAPKLPDPVRGIESTVRDPTTGRSIRVLVDPTTGKRISKIGEAPPSAPPAGIIVQTGEGQHLVNPRTGEPIRDFGSRPGQGSLPTEGERRALAFYRSGKQGYDVLETVLESGKGVPSWTAQQLAKAGMGTGNVLTSGEIRQMRQAALMLSDAWLRFTSGAAVPEQEVERFAESFIPRAGDDEITLAQKRQARKVILDALREGAGRALPQEESKPSQPGSSRPSPREFLQGNP